MRNFWIAFTFVLAAFSFYPAASSAETVGLTLDWVINGRHAPYYVALEKGYWKKAGLDVEISRGFGSSDTVKKIAAGSSTFGFADPGSLVVARARGAKVKLVSIFYGKAPFAVFSKAKTGIRSPKDLAGKNLGAPIGDSIRTVFPAFAKQVGINAGAVNWITMPPAAKAPALLAGKVDGITNFIFDKVKWDREAKKVGPIQMLLFADYGFSIYSNGIAVTDGTASSKPKAIRAFLAGAIKGYEDAINQPKEAVKMFLKHKPLLDPNIAHGEMPLIKRLVLTEDAKKHCIGWIDPGKIAETGRVMLAAHNVKETVDIKTTYTNGFLPCK
jgi:NitT/TauT family transport system substrate-binding protein